VSAAWKPPLPDGGSTWGHSILLTKVEIFDENAVNAVFVGDKASMLGQDANNPPGFPWFPNNVLCPL
jgi:hypothetical protein